MKRFQFNLEPVLNLRKKKKTRNLKASPSSREKSIRSAIPFERTKDR
ncbi:hypothetical protein LEP1GSC038_2950 [Leptospira weilii str. 2006001855]|uniref:Uncharacterized protein n=1 Tax=Leptospira weilii str. 2006001855 TaxID=996804 RepID=M6G3S0_9LEPT|nr:hypothetical protein LEP1GSC038_2950 [Leptospira weilii str. 2006001855]